MKKVLSTLFVATLVFACTVDTVIAQPQGGRGQGRGFGFRGNQADVISDALVLDAKRAEQVTKIYEEVSTELRGTQQPDFSSMTQEERRAAFTEMQEKRQTALTAKLKDVLTEKELEAVTPLLGMRGEGRPVTEIRAVRLIELKDEQRSKIQTIVLDYYKTLESLRPTPQPGQRGMGMSDEVRQKMQDAQVSAIAKIKAELTDEQIEAWNAQIQKVQKEMEAQRQQRGGPGQGGRGPGQGQGRGGQGRGQGRS